VSFFLFLGLNYGRLLLPLVASSRYAFPEVMIPWPSPRRLLAGHPISRRRRKSFHAIVVPSSGLHRPVFRLLISAADGACNLLNHWCASRLCSAPSLSRVSMGSYELIKSAFDTQFPLFFSMNRRAACQRLFFILSTMLLSPFPLPPLHFKLRVIPRYPRCPS